jgi:Glycosyl transferase family 2
MPPPIEHKSRPPGEIPLSRLAVVFAARGSFASIEKTLDCLQSQTAVDRIDLVLTSDSPALLREAERHIQARGVLMNPRFLLNHSPELASARLIAARAATAEILTIAEDHSFPDPNFAEELLAVFDRDPQIEAASPLIHNPNPASAVSRAYFIPAHGCLNPIPGSSRTSEATQLPWHNTTYRKTAFLYAARNVGLMQAEGLLQAEIHRTTPNARFVHCQQTSLWHVNISRLGPALQHTFHGGRIFGAERARHDQSG